MKHSLPGVSNTIAATIRPHTSIITNNAIPIPLQFF